MKLRDWLIERKSEAERVVGRVSGLEGDRTVRGRPSNERARKMRSPLGGASSCWHSARPTAALLADLLGYHRREAKPEWWAYFDRHEEVAR